MPRRSISGAERRLTGTPKTPALRARLLQQAQPRRVCRRLGRRTGQDVCAVSAVYTCILCLVSSASTPPLFSFTIVPKYTYIDTVMHHSMHVPYPSPLHRPRTKLLTLCSPNTSLAFPPRHRATTKPHLRLGVRSPPTQRNWPSSRRLSL